MVLRVRTREEIREAYPHLSFLDYDIAARMTQRAFIEGDITLTARELAEAIVQGFDWLTTPQGNDYWGAVHDMYDGTSAGARHRRERHIQFDPDWSDSWKEIMTVDVEEYDDSDGELDEDY